MAQIGDLIFKLMGKEDPREALVNSIMGGAQQPVAGSPAPGPAGGGSAQPPVGTDPAAAAPPAPAEAPVYQSPSELMGLYSELMKRQESNASINRGIGLMFASAAHPENRAGMISAMSGGGSGGKGSGGDIVSSLMEFQKTNTAAAMKAQQRASVPAIAQQFGMDPTTAMFLFDSGNLDSVIGELSKGNKQLTKGADGRDYIVDLLNATVSDPLGPEKPQEIEVVDGPNGSKIAVDKVTKLPIAGREPMVPEEGNTEFERNFVNAQKERPDLTRDVFRAETNRTTQQEYTDVTGRMVGKPPTDTAWDVDESGKVKIDERNAPIAIPIRGGSADLAAEKAKTEEAEATKAADTKKANAAVTALVIGDEIDRVLKTVNENKDSNFNSPTGPLSMVTQYAPGTAAYQVKNLLETVRGNVGFAKLQQMRDSSPTGAALGPVSDFENKLLQATAGNLEQAQKTEDVVYNLKRIKKLFNYMAFNKVDTPEAAAKMMEEIGAEISSETSQDSSIDDLLEKYK